LYFYRFLRTKTNNLHQSEIENDIEFYTSDECGTNRDFTLNGPVRQSIENGQRVQLLFGMENLNDAVSVLKCFACYKRVLARFGLESLPVAYTIEDDEQVNKTVGSKYVMSDCNSGKISIPSDCVQILSISGWVAKSEAIDVLAEIEGLEQRQYEQLITNAS